MCLPNLPTSGADNGRSCTGVLGSHPQSRDVHIESFTLLYHGHDLLVDATLELNHGRRYGLLGPNGESGSSGTVQAVQCGSSTRQYGGKAVQACQQRGQYSQSREAGQCRKRRACAPGPHGEPPQQLWCGTAAQRSLSCSMRPSPNTPPQQTCFRYFCGVRAQGVESPRCSRPLQSVTSPSPLTLTCTSWTVRWRPRECG